MKKFKILFAFALVAIATTVTLSSFSGKAEAKQTAAIEKKADVKPFAIVTLYFNTVTGQWQPNDPGATCGGNSKFCRLQYDDTGVASDPEDIAIAAAAAYSSAGYLPDSRTSASVNVSNGASGTVTVTIFEKS